MNIAYIWQRSDIDLTKDTGPVLHVKAVIRQLQRRGHQVERSLRNETGRRPSPTTSSSGNRWLHAAPTRPGFERRKALFAACKAGCTCRTPVSDDSLRFADSILPALSGVDLIYERHDLQATGGLMAARRLGVPAVVELNGDVLQEYRVLGIQLSRSQWAVLRQVTRRSYHMASHIVTVSEPLRLSTIAEWNLPPDRVTTVANGVDLEVFTGRVNGDFTEREPATRAPTIIHVGSFKPWHSLDLLVDAFALVVERLPNAELILVGDGELRADIEARVASLGLTDRGQFTGSVPHQQVAEWLARADVAVMAHKPTKEANASVGTPLKLMEYMAAGMAIVAPDLPNIAAIVTDSDTACLYPSGDRIALANSLLWLLTDNEERDRLGASAHLKARASHSWEGTTIRLEQIFDTLLATRAQ